jgi:hypothetical protein
MSLESAMLMSMGVQAAGMGFSASAERRAGQEEQQVYEANAAVLDREAGAAIEAGREEGGLLRERARRLLASQIAAAGAGGGDLGGSTAAVIGDSAYLAERDVQTTLRNSELEAQGLRNRATIQRAYGTAAGRAGNLRAMASVFQGASNMLPLYLSYSRMTGAGLKGNRKLIQGYGGLGRAAASPSLAKWMETV